VRIDVLVALFVALASAFVFLPALRNGFVLWDDDRMFIENQHFRGLGWRQLQWMLTTFHIGHYMPVTWLSFGLDYLLWGMSPVGYHATNVLLHGANAALVYLVALRLLARVMAPTGEATAALRAGAAVAALLFGLHPLRAESVAWATERRDVLSALFYLLAVWCYLRARDGRRPEDGPEPRWYGACLGSFILALLAKSMAVSLPVVLLVLDAYPLRRWLSRQVDGGARLGPTTRRVWLEKVPFVLLALAAGVIAWYALAASGNARMVADVTWRGRAAMAVYGLAFYLWKTALPVGLSPLYERYGLIETLAVPVVSSALVVVLLTTLAIAWRRRWPALVAIWVSYVAILLPVLGIVPNGHQVAADRYTYLACLGWALLAGAAVVRGLEWRGRLPFGLRAPALVTGVAVVALATLGTLSWDQTRVWRDSESLWTHALALDPRSAVAYNNLGAVRSGQRRSEEALALFQTAATLKPDYAAAHFNWGHAVADRGRLDEAIGHFQDAVRLDPRYAPPHNDWGLALVRLGRPAEAVEHFGEALRLNPDFATAESNWGLALLGQGRSAEAKARFARAIALDPGHAEAHYNLGYALAGEGRFAEAIEHFETAVRFRPDFAAAANDWGLALIQLGRHDDAVVRLRLALALRPDLAMGHNNLGLALMHLGRPAEAVEHFGRAIELAPGLALAHANWGLALLQQDRPAEAREHFARALEREPGLAPELERARKNLAEVLGRAQGAPAGSSPGSAIMRPQSPGHPVRGQNER
jgi:tetratricopeptide (TPR) repeat protein